MPYLTKTVFKDTVIFREGSEGYTAYLLRAGEVELSKTVSGKKKVVTVLRPIAMFGEMALILQDHRRTLTASALTDLEMVEISKERFDEFIGQSPPMIRAVLDTLVQRLRVSTNKAAHVPTTFYALSLMVDLTVQHGVTELDFGHTCDALCQFFAITTEEASPVFDQLAQLGMIETMRQKDGSMGLKVLEKGHFAAKAVKRMEAAELRKDAPAIKTFKVGKGNDPSRDAPQANCFSREAEHREVPDLFLDDEALPLEPPMVLEDGGLPLEPAPETGGDGKDKG